MGDAQTPKMGHAMAQAIRNTEGLRRDQRAQRLKGMILNQNRESNGSLIVGDGLPYLFDGKNRRVLPITLENRYFRAMLADRYGLVKSEAITKDVTALLEAEALTEGEPVKVARWTYFDRATNVLYVSNYDGSVWRLDGRSIERTRNGEVVFFRDDDGGMPCAAEIGHHGNLLPTLVDPVEFAEATSGGLLPEAQRVLLSLWIFAIAFPQLLPTKPLVLFEGERGSGKTAAIQQIQLALHGRSRAMSVRANDEDSFAIMLLRSPIALIDNVDTYVEWLRDVLCAYATGGEWVRRKKFTDDDEAVIRPQSFVAIATRNPVSFRRDDLADRTIVFRLARRKRFQALRQIMDGIVEHRPKLYGEWLFLLNEIVARLPQMDREKAESTYRMADFATLAFPIGEAIGIENVRVEEALRFAQIEREIFIVETDPLADLLIRWLATTPEPKEMTAEELIAELSKTAAAAKMPFNLTKYALGKRLCSDVIQQRVSIVARKTRGVAQYLIRTKPSETTEMEKS